MGPPGQAYQFQVKINGSDTEAALEAERERIRREELKRIERERQEREEEERRQIREKEEQLRQKEVLNQY